ncbi:MAG TPA: crosslink repair DNA glycosylase YcaQ family protein, partial [Candidatus Limnocylindrales bacterium]|nr:crosslink repair DNA glycosylase YcaQ family protein [Candidatus Limnocylindrales bacterium]
MSADVVAGNGRSDAAAASRKPAAVDAPRSERRPAAPITISGDVARRYLVLHHLLAPPRSLLPGAPGILAVFDRLGSIQFDPIEIAGRNHDLVLLARVAGYRREQTDELLYGRRLLYETYNKGLSIVPTAELPWYRVAWDRARHQHGAEAFTEHAPLVEELLERIRTTGPMSSIDVEPRAAIEWSWRPTNQVRAILEGLAEAGILGLARRDGNRRVYDLVERLFPAGILAREVPLRDQYRHKLLSRYRAHGLLGVSGSAELWLGTSPRIALGNEGDLPLQAPGRRRLLAELIEAGTLLPVDVEGIRGTRYILAEERGRLEAAEREVANGLSPGGSAREVAFLAALDPLVWDRELLRTLYGFDYI